MSEAIPADDAAGETPVFEEPKASLPVRKRKKEEDAAGEDDDEKAAKRPSMSKAREIRLEQNRKAARESRRRKKNMYV
jgi:hypothetical protein